MVKDKNIKIESLNLKIGDTEIKLSIKDAEKLYDTLNELFETKTVTRYIDHYPYWRYSPLIGSSISDSITYGSNQLCLDINKIGD